MTIREYMLELENKHGSLTPENVFEAGKAEDSPIHHLFEWDVERGWEAHNLARAANLIRKIRVIIRTPDDAGVRVRQFLLTRGNGEAPQSRYLSIERALATPEIREEVIAQARRELQAFERRFANLMRADAMLATGVAQALEALSAA